MTLETIETSVNEVVMMEEVEEVSDTELTKNLISCGNPFEWVKLCDKCSELTRQAEELHQKLNRLERELRCVQQLIWDKARLSIDSADDSKLVKETTDLTKKPGQVWRRLRDHVANKCNVTNNGTAGADTLINPFAEGDKLANYLITLKASTLILPVEHCEDNANEEEDCINVVEETNSQATSSPKIKMEVSPELGLEEEDPQLPHTLGHQNYENLLIDNLAVELEQEVKVEFDDPVEGDKEDDVALEEMEVDAHGGNKLLVQEGLDADKVEEVEVDDDDNEDLEVDEEELSSSFKGIDMDLEEQGPEKYNSTSNSATKLKKEKQIKPKMMRKVIGPPPQKRSSTYIKKETVNKLIRTDDGKIKCRHCDQTFASASGLNCHERDKHPKTPGTFICDICGRAFNSGEYLKKHTKQSHKLNPDGIWETVKPRKRTRTEDGKIKCRHCDQSFSTRSGCSSHQLEKHSKTPGAFICDICGGAFNSRGYLRSHKTCFHRVKADGTPIPPKVLKPGKNAICEQCGKGFTSSKLLQKHVRFVHEKRFNFNCSSCGAGWRSRNGLKKHLLALHPEDPSTKQLIEEEGLGLWKCPVVGCSTRFLKESGIKGHLKSIHGRDEEMIGRLVDLQAGAKMEDPELEVTCPTCGKVFGSKQCLRKHEKVVHENEGKEKKFICETCGGGFVSKEYLRSHIDRVHLKKGMSKGRDFKCEICGKGFGYQNRLKRHIELHEKKGRRDHFCDKCGHGFTLDKYLREHKRVTNCGVEGETGEDL